MRKLLAETCASLGRGFQAVTIISLLASLSLLTGGQAGHEVIYQAYLFSHMMKYDYGGLYYSVSLDGLHWQLLNDGKRVFPEYHGHSCIAQGADGRYYLVGNRSDEAPDINFWVSDDLIHWTKYADYTPDLMHVPDYPHPLARIGAPKLYFDKPSAQFVMTWHTPSVPGTKEDPERYWASQRTLYVTSPDLKHFSDPPRRLFSFEMATIDVIIRPNPDGGYAAILKDERYPSYEWTTGKTIRISFSPYLLGPYSEPGLPISPNFREAPTLIPSPDGHDWYLYYEQYAGTSYGLSIAPKLRGPWYQVSGNTGVPAWNKYEVPPGVRHGSMMPITKEQYNAITGTFKLP
jgi:hypothetical protein